MNERAEFLIRYASQHAPVTVRQLYYAAEVAGIPGIEKTEASYDKVQRQVLKLRREGLISYTTVVDGTRSAIGGEFGAYRPTWQETLRHAAQDHYFSLWYGVPYRVQVWLEKDALAGVVEPALRKTRVPLMVARGQSSETFVHECISDLHDAVERLYVIALFDCDRAGHDAARSLEEKLKRFCERDDYKVDFMMLGLHPEQVRSMSLPTRPPKRKTAADRRWPHDFAAELDAIPPDTLRKMVSDAVATYMPDWRVDEHDALVDAERAEAVRWVAQAEGAA